MKSEWFIWCVTKNEPKAMKLLARVAEGLDCTPDDVWSEWDEDIPGYSVHFTLPVNGRSWADGIIWLFDLGYHIAVLWIVLPGWRDRSICDGAEAFSDDCRIPGVRRIQWRMESDAGS